jgi:short-subunit dehydrogenase
MNFKKYFKDKVVIITGASSGIGLACVNEFASHGSIVVLAARSLEIIKNVAENINLNGGKALAIKTDVTNPKDCENLISETIKHFGRIDILINNAGISMRALFVDVDFKVIRQLMEVNFFGTVYCSKYALPYLIKSKGSLIGISSIAGFHGLPGRTGYSASKFAMHGLLETIRIENFKNGLHVMIVAPGFTSSNIRKNALLADGSKQGESPRIEERMMKPEEVARAIVRGIIFRRRNIILTKQGMLTVFLQRILPRLIDKIIYKHMATEPDSPFK